LLIDEKKNNPDGRILIKEFPPSSITPKQIEAFIKKIVDSGERIDAVVIDYLSLLTTEKGTNSYERVKYICEQIRALSYIFKCPFFSACQLSKPGYGKDNPGLEGIGESMGIAHVSDCIMSIFQSDEDMELGIIKLGMIKNRYGARGMVQPMRIEYETLTVLQSEESAELMDDDDLSILERLTKN
jgi:replicative DNA helicase